MVGLVQLVHGLHEHSARLFIFCLAFKLEPYSTKRENTRGSPFPRAHIETANEEQNQRASRWDSVQKSQWETDF